MLSLCSLLATLLAIVSVTLPFHYGEAPCTLHDVGSDFMVPSSFFLGLNDLDSAVAHNVTLPLLVFAVAYEHDQGGHGHDAEHNDTGDTCCRDHGAALNDGARLVAGRDSSP